MSAAAFDRVRPTYIENWPPALRALSISDVDIALSLGEAAALGLRNPKFRIPCEVAPEPLCRVEREIGAAIERFPRGAFVRLGSRSGKDSEHAETFGLRVTTATAALACLTERSRRTAYDLRLALSNAYAPHVFVREWVDIPAWAELRCFVRGRALVGVSQYDVKSLGHSDELASVESEVRREVERFMPSFVDASHLDDVVADVFFEAGEPERIRLLEINPFDVNTDPCLFTWDGGGDFDGSFRFL